MPVSFAAEIAPLFNAHDVACMKRRGVNLHDYSYMSDAASDGTFLDHANARDVLARLTGDEQPQMPMGGPYWPQSQIDTFKQWLTDGFAA
jgi:hypothetical protein